MSHTFVTQRCWLTPQRPLVALPPHITNVQSNHHTHTHTHTSSLGSFSWVDLATFSSFHWCFELWTSVHIFPLCGYKATGKERTKKQQRKCLSVVSYWLRSVALPDLFHWGGQRGATDFIRGKRFIRGKGTKASSDPWWTRCEQHLCPIWTLPHIYSLCRSLVVPVLFFLVTYFGVGWRQ